MHVLGAGWFSDANQRGEDLEGAQKGSLGTHHGQHHCRVDMEAQQGPVRPRRMSLEIYRVPYTVLASKTRVLPFAMARKDSGSGDILIGATLLGDHGLQILWGNGSQHHEAPRHHKQ